MSLISDNELIGRPAPLRPPAIIGASRARLTGRRLTMAYNSKAKVKVLYLWKILQEETDAEHGLTMPQIIERLAKYGVRAERKSLYADIRALREFDVDVKMHRRNPVEYAIERRDFSLDELMLLVDAVHSCRAITDKQAKALVINIKQLATNREQDLLDRRIHVVGRVQSLSDNVLSTVDVIHEALRLRCKISFAYRRIGVDGKPYETHGGRERSVSPVSVSYEDGFYYLTAWDDERESMSEYRLDRMVRVRVLAGEPAMRNEEISRFSYGDAQAVRFGRFSGDEVIATLAADPDKVGILVDRLGKAATFLPTDGSEARVRVRVCKSEQFFGWVASMDRKVRIVAPASLLEEYRAYLRSLLGE